VTEIDVDMAVYALGEAASELLAAARRAESRPYVRANLDRLMQDFEHLSECIAVASGGGRARNEVIVQTNDDDDSGAMRRRVPMLKVA